VAHATTMLASPTGAATFKDDRRNGKVLASPTGARDTYEAGHGATYELPLRGTVRKAAAILFLALIDVCAVSALATASAAASALPTL